jgi:type II secretory pathway pseudopilin PulG
MKRLALHTQLAPLIVALVLLAVGGFMLIQKEDQQARDTIRKHHLADIETALELAKRQNGQFPPYDQLTWCGVISDPANKAVQDAIELPLRQSVDKYGNRDKPFPQDPNNSVKNYYYWKRSPDMFELYSILEAAPTGDRNTFSCATGLHTTYDYGISSILREGANGSTIEHSPL